MGKKATRISLLNMEEEFQEKQEDEVSLPKGTFLLISYHV
jgi:hypothetical protein